MRNKYVYVIESNRYVLTQQPRNDIRLNILSWNCFSNEPRERSMRARSSHFFSESTCGRTRWQQKEKEARRRHGEKRPTKLAEIFSDESDGRKAYQARGFLGLDLRIQPTQRIAKSRNKDQRLHGASRISLFPPFLSRTLLSPLFFYI